MKSGYSKTHLQKMELASYNVVGKTINNKDNKKEMLGKCLINS